LGNRNITGRKRLNLKKRRKGELYCAGKIGYLDTGGQYCCCNY
jgi:hypothetical protein